MNCPKCGAQEFRPINAEGVELDFCPHCRGLWFDHEELAFYVETEKDIPNFKDSSANCKAGELCCPKCVVTKMIEMPYLMNHDLMIDFCPSCQGIWLDQGEIVQIEKLAAKVETNSVKRLSRVVQQLKSRGFIVLK